MSGHYDELTPSQVDAARTVIAVLTASDDTAPDVLALLQEAIADSPVSVLEGFAVVLDALLQLIEGELGLTPAEVLGQLARFLAS